MKWESASSSAATAWAKSTCLMTRTALKVGGPRSGSSRIHIMACMSAQARRRDPRNPFSVGADRGEGSLPVFPGRDSPWVAPSPGRRARCLHKPFLWRTNSSPVDPIYNICDNQDISQGRPRFSCGVLRLLAGRPPHASSTSLARGRGEFLPRRLQDRTDFVALTNPYISNTQLEPGTAHTPGSSPRGPSRYAGICPVEPASSSGKASTEGRKNVAKEVRPMTLGPFQSSGGA